VSQIVLHRFQRSLIPSFTNYNLNPKKHKLADKLQMKRYTTYPTDLVLSRFDPARNVADNMILYYVTGKKKTGGDGGFSDSSDDESEDVIFEVDYTNSGRVK